MKPTQILFVDDHVLFRESVVRLLGREPDMEIVAQCGTLVDARRLLQSHAFDVVLLDYDLGAEFGTNLLSSVITGRQSPRVIMVTGGMQTLPTMSAVKAGISGIVLKHSEPDRLVHAIREVQAGRMWWDNGVLPSGISPAPEPGASIPKSFITERQRQVLLLILDGLTNKEIAAKTNSSEYAVKASIQEMFSKVGVRTRSQLVRIAVENHSSDWLKA